MRPASRRLCTALRALWAPLLITGGAVAHAAGEAGLANDPATHLDLAWNAPAGCPSRSAVLAEVKRTLRGGQAAAPNDPPLPAQVDVTSDAPGHFVGALRLTAAGQVHERHLEADSCQAVASAAALIMALAVEGVLPAAPALASPAEAPATPASPAAPAAQAAPTAPVAPVAPPVAQPEKGISPPTAASTAPSAGSPPGRSVPWTSQLVVSAAALVDTATLPSVAVGPEVGVGWHLARRALRLGLSAHGVYFPSLFGGAATAATAGEGGRFGLLEGSLRACGGLAWKNLEIGPCLALAGDHMSGSGRGSSVTLSGSGDWASAQGMALASYSFTRWLALEAQVGAAVPFARPTFVDDSSSGGATAVHRPASISARTGIGLQLRFF